MEQGGKLAHRWCKGPTDRGVIWAHSEPQREATKATAYWRTMWLADRQVPRPLSEACSGLSFSAVTLQCQLAYARKCFRAWSQFGSEERTPMRTAARQAVRELRAELLASTMSASERAEWCDKVRPGKIRAVCRAAKRTTSIGLDLTTFQELAEAPLEVLESLSSIFVSMVETLVVPSQLLANLLFLIPKKKGGHRTIATMATIMRIFFALCACDLHSWDSEVALDGADGTFDTAAPSVVALDHALFRALEAETAFLLKEHYVAILWDVQAFFDLSLIHI